MFWYFLVTYAVVLEIAGFAAFTLWILKKAPKWQAQMSRDLLIELNADSDIDLDGYLK